MTNMIVTCSYCGSDIERRPSEIRRNKSGRFYCNADCRNKGWTGKSNPNYGNNWTDEQKDELSAKILEQYDGWRDPWNKGLDKTDPRVRKNTRHLKGNKFGRGNKGKKHPKLREMNLNNNPMWDPEIKAKMMRNMPLLFGEKNPNWRGGKRVISYRGRDWKRQRKKALKRDNYTCIYCGATEDLVVHHIDPWQKSHNNELSNLETVCRPCHIRIEPIGPK